MNTNIGFRIIAAIVLIAALVGLGVYVYNVGVINGMASNAQLQAGDLNKGVPSPALMYGRHWIGFGMFGCFGLLVPLFLILLFFCALRMLFGYRPRYWGPGMHHIPWAMHMMGEKGDWCQGTPPFFDEWHRRAHEKQSTADKQEDQNQGS
jgi:hypothetical protein